MSTLTFTKIYAILENEKDNMKQIILTILGTSIMNIFTFIIAQGFIKSYYGRQAREEISRWFDKTSKHMQKLKRRK